MNQTTSAKVIDLSKFNGPVYAGRARGQNARKLTMLDDVDAVGGAVVVEVPDDTYTVTSSFFLGLFGPSVIKAGSKEAFYQRYQFHNPDFLTEEFETYVGRALQSREIF